MKKTINKLIIGAVCLFSGINLNAQTSDNNWNGAFAGQYPSTDVYCSAIVGNYCYIGGLFLEVGGNSNLKNLARFNFTTNQWEQVPQITSSFSGGVRTMKVDSDGNLWVGGEFTSIGSITVNRIAKFNTSTNTWSRLMDNDGNVGHPSGAIYSMEISGDDLYIGGQSWGADTSRLQCIRKYNFTTQEWSALDKGIHGANTTVRSIVADGNGSIYVGGHFPKVNNDNTPTGTGGLDANHIAKWDGTSWSTLGTGMTELVDNNSTYSGLPWVKTLCYDQANQLLYAGGGFLKANGTNARNIAKWDGTTWSGMAGGFEKEVYAIQKNGNNLYIGGQFLYDFNSLNTNNRHVSNWNGTEWTPLGTGVGQDSFTQAVLTISAAGNNVFFGGTFYDVATYTGPGGIRRFAHWREVVSTTGVNELSNNIQFYPNPTSQQITVSGLNPGDVLYIKDLSGREILSKEIHSSQEILQLSNLNCGQYLLIVKTETQNFVEKLFVE
jgi:trimeric autotransporter adhesin